ncbi:hypothetical protein AUR64_03665 [Haloprofundus marisrubri]|uniref:Uncharacterized protein n=1 Tax=Haloprofundus marisrubri TaxID=1514971 RepID=A0A0W1RE06_9EURY|nr:hypothetical protein [Haloprofundus marisrubri]KTG11366.1 hypothetical protein AUR64_03665 [Haloprofundus marisrubri]
MILVEERSEDVLAAVLVEVGDTRYVVGDWAVLLEVGDVARLFEGIAVALRFKPVDRIDR